MSSEVVCQSESKSKVLALVPRSIRFKGLNICGLKMGELELSTEEVLSYRYLLIEQGLLNEEDDLLAELQCEFYMQAIYPVILKFIREQSTKAA